MDERTVQARRIYYFRSRERRLVSDWAPVIVEADWSDDEIRERLAESNGNALGRTEVIRDEVNHIPIMVMVQDLSLVQVEIDFGGTDG